MSTTLLDSLFKKLNDGFDKFDDLYSLVQSGNNIFSHDVTVERLILDESWVNAIDSALRSIENISRAPKKSIKEEHLIVAVEKANKVTQKSIQHLANHSENIKYANSNEIMPSKVLTSIVEENLAIYENRFIITLLNKLNGFVDERYKVIKKILRVTCHDKLEMDSSFKLGRSRVNCKVIFDIKDLPDDDSNKKNAQIITKVDLIKRRLTLLKKSDFYISLKGAKPLYPPIVKTNILTKNVDYNNAYKLWVFMAGYAEEGFTLEVLHKSLPCDDNYCDDLVAVLSVLTSTNVVNHNIRREAFNNLALRKSIDRRYKVVSRFNYKPTFARAPLTVGEDVVNEYFFRNMESVLKKGTGIDKVTPSTIVQEKNVLLPFSKFYRAVSHISNEMYKDVLAVGYKQSRKVNPTRNDVLKIEVERQREVIKRAKILSSLKADEYEKQLKAEAREELKLMKLQRSMQDSDVKKLDRQIDEYVRRNSSRKIKAREDAVLSAAKEYKTKIVGIEQERVAKQDAEAKAAQVTLRKEERERKLLALLKQKYESDEQ